MSGRPASTAQTSDGSLPRLLVQGADSEELFDVFSVVAASGDIVQVRSALLFEVGEQLWVRLERDGAVVTGIARVRGHLGPDDARVTELEITARTDHPGERH
jgi:hypothetical protein